MMEKFYHKVITEYLNFVDIKLTESETINTYNITKL